ncbi:MAG: FkbM family methyltransferase, partial [Elusimicrobiota bacterium]
VKVGANDGVTGDPCSDILLSGTRWKGLLIEPVPHIFDRLKANFPDAKRYSLEQSAVGAAAGETTFYYVDKDAIISLPDLPHWYDKIGSFDRNHIVKLLDGVLEPHIRECAVEVQTLTAILKKNGIRDIHLLHIDTEGFDLEVLKTLDFAAYAPLLIFAEHLHLSAADKKIMIELLREHGYSVRDCGGDYFAVHEEAYGGMRTR